MIDHFHLNLLFPRDSLQSLNFPTGHSLLIEHGQTNDSSHELKTGNLLSKGGTPLRPIKFFLPWDFFRDRSIWKSWFSSFQRYQTFQFSILKNVALIDLKIDGPNLVKSEGFFLKWIVCATWWLNIGKSDMFSG